MSKNSKLLKGEWKTSDHEGDIFYPFDVYFKSKAIVHSKND